MSQLLHGTFNTAARARASLIHLGTSAAVAVLAAGLVFVLWYPLPYREISGGRELFLLVVAVDVVVGPLITFAVYDRRKPKRGLMRDLGVVVLLQLAALAYGLHAVAQARPAIVALEGARLRVVRAIDLADADLTRAPPPLRSLSWSGPRLVAARPPTPDEKQETMERGLVGEDIGMRPAFWLAPDLTAKALGVAAMPLDRLARMQPARKAELDVAVAATGVPADQLGYLPILARRTDWSALVERHSGEIVGYVNIEGF